ncbi:right-handed parallel beta-helix repeat-containing protein [Amycolatopsis sp. MtRt-6]|uniref:right-handed parallel beta-helix repeat-containing protein n=1 Tax=Amycolatopsis sp. MtRt-6 TaxID=2792782 RepID=UPI001A8CC62C|nr:right-handed parallel beta-helix repeat-containing protein [Amycolatopsis sp. MtRt-6]
MRALSVFLVSVLAVAGCSSSLRPDVAGAATIRVPQDAPTVQQAVDAARPGDLVLVSPGVYRESVRITVPDLVLRGTDRNRVVFDGEVRRANGIVVTAPGVAVENLTVRDHVLNGVLVTGMADESGGLARGSDGYTRLDPARFPPVQGFRVSYVTASNNGLYGVYAFDSQHGVIEHSYASGSADSGFYVGQCHPCDIVVRGNVAERNAVGYEGTNASGGMSVVGNRFVGNRVGLSTNSDYQEAFVPQRDAAIVGNLVAANAQAGSPAQADGGFGVGIGIAGGTRNLLARNLVTGNPGAGIALASAEDLAPSDNRLVGNVLSGNGVDVAYAASERAPGSGNCLQDNVLTSTAPAGLAGTMACPARPGAAAGVRLALPPAPRGVPFPDVAAPPEQPGLPDAATAPPRPARGLPGPVDLDGYPVPQIALLAEHAGVKP